MRQGLQIKNMSLNHWKLVNYIRDLLGKSQGDSSVMSGLTKEWINLFQKFPHLTGIVQTLPSSSKKYYQSNSIKDDNDKAAEDSTVKAIPVSEEQTQTVVKQQTQTELIQDVAYGMIEGLRSRLSPKTNNESSAEKILVNVPKWKIRKDASVSKVCSFFK